MITSCRIAYFVGYWLTLIPLLYIVNASRQRDVRLCAGLAAIFTVVTCCVLYHLE